MNYSIEAKIKEQQNNLYVARLNESLNLIGFIFTPNKKNQLLVSF